MVTRASNKTARPGLVDLSPSKRERNPKQIDSSSDSDDSSSSSSDDTSDEEKKVERKAKRARKKAKKKAEKKARKKSKKKSDKPGRKDINAMRETQDAGLVAPNGWTVARAGMYHGSTRSICLTLDSGHCSFARLAKLYWKQGARNCREIID